MLKTINMDMVHSIQRYETTADGKRN